VLKRRRTIDNVRNKFDIVKTSPQSDELEPKCNFSRALLYLWRLPIQYYPLAFYTFVKCIFNWSFIIETIDYQSKLDATLALYTSTLIPPAIPLSPPVVRFTASCEFALIKLSAFRKPITRSLPTYYYNYWQQSKNEILCPIYNNIVILITAIYKSWHSAGLSTLFNVYEPPLKTLVDI